MIVFFACTRHTAGRFLFSLRAHLLQKWKCFWCCMLDDYALTWRLTGETVMIMLSYRVLWWLSMHALYAVYGFCMHMFRRFVVTVDEQNGHSKIVCAPSVPRSACFCMTDCIQDVSLGELMSQQFAQCVQEYYGDKDQRTVAQLYLTWWVITAWQWNSCCRQGMFISYWPNQDCVADHVTRWCIHIIKAILPNGMYAIYSQGHLYHNINA